MEKPVYLFTGFLESGKTNFILQVLNDPSFSEGQKTLLICCEQGFTEYDEHYLKEKLNTDIVYIDELKDLTTLWMEQLDKKYQPDEIMIEYNGMWSVTELLDHVEMPVDWILAQIVSTVDASSFEAYIRNMRSIMYDQLVHSEMIVINRCSEKTKKSFLRSNIKAINQRAQIIYESVDGSINSIEEDELPFDLNAPLIEIKDDDFGLWYIDAIEHPEKYIKKHVQVKGKAYEPADESVTNCAFVLGRNAMVCCADDVQPIGIFCYWQFAGQLIPQEWVQIEGIMDMIFDEELGVDVPIIQVENLKVVPPMQNELVYFS